MRMLIDFYTGDTDAVMKMLSARSQGQSVVKDDALVQAAFPRNLQQDDLDALSQQLHRMAGHEAVGVFDSLDDDLDSAPGQRYGIHILRDAWVKTVAEFPDAQVEELAAGWLQTVGKESGKPRRPSKPEAIAAIQDLLAVCRKAAAGEMPVVFYWSS